MKGFESPEWLKDEVDFIINQTFIIQKNEILKKISWSLKDIREDLIELGQSDGVLNQIKFPQGKISKGENYHGLPYQVLDYPAIFKRNDVFAYRTVFWWGNYISHVLVLKGKYFKHYAPLVLSGFKKNPDSTLMICLDDNPWNHEFNRNYIKYKKIELDSLQTHIDKTGFLKFGVKYPLSKISSMKKNALATIKEMSKLMEG